MDSGDLLEKETNYVSRLQARQSGRVSNTLSLQKACIKESLREEKGPEPLGPAAEPAAEPAAKPPEKPWSPEQRSQRYGHRVRSIKSALLSQPSPFFEPEPERPPPSKPAIPERGSSTSRECVPRSVRPLIKRFNDLHAQQTPPSPPGARPPDEPMPSGPVLASERPAPREPVAGPAFRPSQTSTLARVRRRKLPESSFAPFESPADRGPPGADASPAAPAAPAAPVTPVARVPRVAPGTGPSPRCRPDLKQRRILNSILSPGLGSNDGAVSTGHSPSPCRSEVSFLSPRLLSPDDRMSPGSCSFREDSIGQYFTEPGSGKAINRQQLVAKNLEEEFMDADEVLQQAGPDRGFHVKLSPVSPPGLKRSQNEGVHSFPVPPTIDEESSEGYKSSEDPEGNLADESGSESIRSCDIDKALNDCADEPTEEKPAPAETEICETPKRLNSAHDSSKTVQNPKDFFQRNHGENKEAESTSVQKEDKNGTVPPVSTDALNGSCLPEPASPKSLVEPDPEVVKFESPRKLSMSFKKRVGRMLSFTLLRKKTAKKARKSSSPLVSKTVSPPSTAELNASPVPGSIEQASTMTIVASVTQLPEEKEAPEAPEAPTTAEPVPSPPPQSSNGAAPKQLENLKRDEETVRCEFNYSQLNRRSSPPRRSSNNRDIHDAVGGEALARSPDRAAGPAIDSYHEDQEDGACVQALVDDSPVWSPGQAAEPAVSNDKGKKKKVTSEQVLLGDVYVPVPKKSPMSAIVRISSRVKKTVTTKFKKSFRKSGQLGEGNEERPEDTVPQVDESQLLPSVAEKVAELRGNIEVQDGLISRARQSLALLGQPELHGSRERVEEERALLLATLHKNEYLERLADLVTRNELPEPAARPEEGDLRIKSIGLKIAEPFLQMDVHSRYFVEWFLLVISGSGQFWASEAAVCSEQRAWLFFPEHADFQRLGPDFRLSLRIFRMAVMDPRDPNSPDRGGDRGAQRERSSAARRSLELVEETSCNKRVGNSAFTECARLEVTIEHFRRSSSYKLTEKRRNCTLDGKIQMTLDCTRLQLNVSFSGLLSLGLGRADGSIKWRHYACVVNDSAIKFLRFPSDIYFHRQPRYVLDLTRCTARTIRPPSWEVCARKRTLLIPTERERKEDDAETRHMHLKSDNVTVVKHLLHFDTKTEYEEWTERLNYIISALRNWSRIELRN